MGPHAIPEVDPEPFKWIVRHCVKANKVENHHKRKSLQLGMFPQRKANLIGLITDYKVELLSADGLRKQLHIVPPRALGLQKVAQQAQFGSLSALFGKHIFISVAGGLWQDGFSSMLQQKGRRMDCKPTNVYARELLAELPSYGKVPCDVTETEGSANVENSQCVHHCTSFCRDLYDASHAAGWSAQREHRGWWGSQEGGRRDRLYNSRTRSGSRAATLWLGEPSGTDVRAGNVPWQRIIRNTSSKQAQRHHCRCGGCLYHNGNSFKTHHISVGRLFATSSVPVPGTGNENATCFLGGISCFQCSQDGMEFQVEWRCFLAPRSAPLRPAAVQRDPAERCEGGVLPAPLEPASQG